MADIQKRVDEKNSRGTFSRIFHTQNDKNTIAAWKEDLDRLLHIFNVRSVSSASLSLTTPFQTELAIDTNVAATETDRKVTDMHEDVLVIKESVANRQFSVRRPFPHQGTEPDHPLESNQVSYDETVVSTF